MSPLASPSLLLQRTVRRAGVSGVVAQLVVRGQGLVLRGLIALIGIIGLREGGPPF